MRAHLRFSILDLVITTTIVGFASLLGRTRPEGGLVVGTLMLAFWSISAMIYGLIIRQEDERDSEAFYQAWGIKFVLLLAVMFSMDWAVRNFFPYK